MNIEAYIASGKVEAYVLGIATEEVVREIEDLLAKYPALRAVVAEQEDLLINYAAQHAVTPPPQLKQAIWETLGKETINEAQPTITNIANIPLPPNVPSAATGWSRYAMAASVALLVASGAGNIWMMNRNKEMHADLTALADQQKSMLEEKNNATAAVQQANASLQILSLPKLIRVNLAGVGAHTAHSGMLYWDGATGDVFVDLSNMPQAPAGKQYQLWAIVDGKPVDAGMYDTATGLTIHRMKTIAKAEMFAITIENAGGSPAPTMDQMVVAGKTS